MCADAGNEYRHVAYDSAHFGEFFRIGRADHEAAFTFGIPSLGHEPCDMLVERHVGAVGAHRERLQFVAAGVGRAAQDDRALAGVGEIRRDCIVPQIRLQCDRVGAIALEHFARVLLRGRAHVAALGVEDDRDVGVAFLDVCDQRFEFVFRAVSREVGNLRLERANKIVRGIDDGAAKFEDRVGPANMARELRWVGIQADAQEALGARPARREEIGEGWHGRRAYLHRDVSRQF